MESVEELVSFLRTSNNVTLVRQKAAKSLCELSASAEGRELIASSTECIKQLLTAASHRCDVSGIHDHPEIGNSALQTLINVSSDEKLAERLLSFTSVICFLDPLVAATTTEKDNELVNLACMLMSNLTRVPLGSREVIKAYSKISTTYVVSLMKLLCEDRPYRYYLGPIMRNLTQLEEFRSLILQKDSHRMYELLARVSFSHSAIFRKGIVGAVRNCCFDTSTHEWLLNEPYDALSKLIYPLAGPEEFDEETNDKLPITVQFLGEDKKREPESEIRKMIIECIHQLCATKYGRELIKEKQIYVILRELHKWEPADDVIVAIENLVDILIGDEPSSEFSNLKEVEVPVDLQEKFRKMDLEVDEKIE